MRTLSCQPWTRSVRVDNSSPPVLALLISSSHSDLYVEYAILSNVEYAILSSVDYGLINRAPFCVFVNYKWCLSLIYMCIVTVSIVPVHIFTSSFIVMMMGLARCVSYCVTLVVPPPCCQSLFLHAIDIKV